MCRIPSIIVADENRAKRMGSRCGLPIDPMYAL
jgi:hypothetical protein